MTNPPSRNGGTLAKAADCMKGECMWFSQPIAWFADPNRSIAKIPGAPTNNDAATRTYNLKICSGTSMRTHAVHVDAVFLTPLPPAPLSPG